MSNARIFEPAAVIPTKAAAGSLTPSEKLMTTRFSLESAAHCALDVTIAGQADLGADAATVGTAEYLHHRRHGSLHWRMA